MYVYTYGNKRLVHLQGLCDTVYAHFNSRVGLYIYQMLLYKMGNRILVCNRFDNGVFKELACLFLVFSSVVFQMSLHFVNQCMS